MKTIDKYDTIIVGAGPAGCMAALNSGENTLLVEKKEEIGVPVHCGEGVFGKIIDLFDLYDYVEDSHTLNDIEFSFPNGKKKKIRLHTNDMYVINKDKVLQRMVKTAIKERGVEVRTGTKASFKNGKLFLNGEEVEGKVIIAADGIASSIGRAAGISLALDPKDIHVCAQYTVKDNIDPNTMQLFFGNPYTSTGYVWVIPKGKNIANIGLGIQSSRHLNTKHHLDWFMSENYPDAEKTNFFTAPVPLAPPADHCMQGNIMLVGDAARFCIAVSGAGIGNAFLSGQFAAETAVNYLHGTKDLESYQYAMILKLYRKLTKAYKFKQKLMKKGMGSFYNLARPVFWIHNFAPVVSENILLRNFKF